MIDSSFSFPLHFRASSWVMGFAAITGEELQWWKTTSPFGPPFVGRRRFQCLLCFLFPPFLVLSVVFK